VTVDATDGDYEARIHKALIDAVHAADFRRIVFEGTALTIGDPMPCRTAVASPITSSFREPLLNRMHRMRERSEWQWELILKFEGRASLEAFERQVAANPPRVPRDATHDHQVLLLIAEARYAHPTHAQPQSGTEVVYRFVAELTPV
jgi:hypothetical protein